MSAWDEILAKTAVIRKQSQYKGSQHELISQVLRDNPGLYQRYLAERRRGVVSAQEGATQAEADAVSKQQTTAAIPAETALLMAYAEERIRQGEEPLEAFAVARLAGGATLRLWAEALPGAQDRAAPPDKMSVVGGVASALSAVRGHASAPARLPRGRPDGDSHEAPGGAMRDVSRRLQRLEAHRYRKMVAGIAAEYGLTYDELMEEMEAFFALPAEPRAASRQYAGLHRGRAGGDPLVVAGNAASTLHIRGEPWPIFSGA